MGGGWAGVGAAKDLESEGGAGGELCAGRVGAVEAGGGWDDGGGERDGEGGK